MNGSVDGNMLDGLPARAKKSAARIRHAGRHLQENGLVAQGEGSCLLDNPRTLPHARESRAVQLAAHNAQIVDHRKHAGHTVGHEARDVPVGLIAYYTFQRHIPVLHDNLY